MSAYQQRKTAHEIVSTVAQSFGLDAPGSTFSSTDGNIIQMRGLLNIAGQKLLARNRWQFLSREQALTGDGVATEFALPTDFDRYVRDSQWNRTTRLPAIGNLQEQEWQYLKARLVSGSTFTLFFQIADNKVVFYQPPPTGNALVLPYISRSWVKRSDNTYADNATNDGDTVLFDSEVIRAALEVEWCRRKGLDFASSSIDLRNAITAAMSKDAPGRTISISPTAIGQPLIGAYNVPETGYGQ